MAKALKILCVAPISDWHFVSTTRNKIGRFFTQGAASLSLSSIICRKVRGPHWRKVPSHHIGKAGYSPFKNCFLIVFGEDILIHTILQKNSEIKFPEKKSAKVIPSFFNILYNIPSIYLSFVFLFFNEGVSDSYPARLLTKIFKSAETVNEKFDVYEFGDKGQ